MAEENEYKRRYKLKAERKSSAPSSPDAGKRVMRSWSGPVREKGRGARP